MEWLQEMPGKPWGIRSIPEIDSRYPLWDQPNFVRDVDEGRFYLPDAEEGMRETIVTSVIDAKPQQCLRLPGSSFITVYAAISLGGFFILGTYHLWWLSMLSLAVSIGVFSYWLWTGPVPEKVEKNVGLGLTLPTYLSGPTSISWWAMCITMLADLTAFISLVFGCFFYWTIHEDFPPKPCPGPGVLLATDFMCVVAWCLAAYRSCSTMEWARSDFCILYWTHRSLRVGHSRRSGFACRALGNRSGSARACLPSDGMASRDLDSHSCCCRNVYAALLSRAANGRSNDLAIQR